MMVLSTASNTVLQTIVDEDKRGRILSLYTMVFLGTAPVGSLVAGAWQRGSPRSRWCGLVASAAWWGAWCSPTTCPPCGLVRPVAAHPGSQAERHYTDPERL